MQGPVIGISCGCGVLAGSPESAVWLVGFLVGTLHSGLLIPAVATSAVAVLGGMGAARGVFNGFEVLLVESRVVADSAIAAFTAVAPDDSALEELVKDGGKIQDQIDRFRSEEAQVCADSQ